MLGFVARLSPIATTRSCHCSESSHKQYEIEKGIVAFNNSFIYQNSYLVLLVMVYQLLTRIMLKGKSCRI